MTGAVSVSAPLPGVRGARTGLGARAGAGVVLALCSAVSVGWLALGAVVAVVRYWPSAARPVLAAAAAGDPWARAVVEAAPASEPLGQAVPDYAFSVLNLVLATVLLVSGRRGTGTRTWPIRLLAVALVGSAGAFNLQAHAAARAIEAATGLAVGVVHQVVLHGVACAAYILALLVFPTPSWDGLPGGRSARRSLAVVGAVTFLLVGLGTALLPHTVSCVLFFGFLVPAVGLVVLPRRVRRGPGAEARIQARLLFSTLVGGFAVAAVLGVVTLLLWALDGVPGLAMVDPTTHGHSGEPVALLFWFSRLASAAIAVVVLVATRHDGLWTAERWFSRGLAVLLVTAVAGGGCVVLRTLLVGVLGAGGATAAATVVAALGLSPLYVRAERVVDRLLYGTRPAPYRVLADIAALSRSTLSQSTPDQPSGAPDLNRVAEAVALGLGASVCRLTVRRPGLRDRTYEWTDRTSGPGGRPDTGGDLVEVPIRHGAEQVGALAVDRQAVSGLNAQRDRLLVDIADGLGVVLEASRSGIELERQLRAAIAHAEEIAESRRRTVAEMDAERRRIERDLHDGAQHHLVSLRLTLGLVEHQVGTGAFDQAREWLGKLGEQLENAEAVLAATADGVSSLVLVEKGLVAALAAELDAAHPPVAFDDGAIPADRRFPADVEAAVWFCCAEAVGNARKHAGGAPVSVRLAERAGELGFTVRDEGPGFTPDPDGQPGRGLRNMTTRVSTVGGRVVIRSLPGGGTTVEGVVPLPGAAASPRAGSRVAEPLTVRITTRTAAQLTGTGGPGSPTVHGGGPGAVGDFVEPAAAPVAVVEPEPVVVDEAEPEPAVEPAAVEPAAVEPAAVEPAAVEPAAVEPAAVEPAAVEPAAEPLVESPGRERPGRLAGQVRELVRAACAAYRGGVGQDHADELAARLDEPVRIGVLATVDDGRRMLVEALVGTPAMQWPLDGAALPGTSDGGEPVPVRYVFGDPATPAGPDAAVVGVAAPALRAMTLVDVPSPDGPDSDPAVSRRLGPAGADRMRALLAPPGRAPVADAFVLLLHYGRPADLTLLDLLDSAGYRGAIGVLAVADDVDAVVERAVREYGDDPAVRRVCHSIVPVAPATAAAAARLGDTEHRWLHRWVSATGDDATGDDPVAPAGRGLRRPDGATTGAHPAPEAEIATALLDRLGPLGARRALRLVRSGEGATRTELATALVRHSGLDRLQELIASRFLHRAEALRTRSVLAGLDALLQASPPSGDDARLLRYQLEQIRAGAHELREIESLDVLRSGDLRLPPEQLRVAERLLGADGGDLRARLGLAADATVEQVRAVATAQPARWRAIAEHPVASTRVREFAQVLVRTCERLAAEVDDDVPAMR